jgi:hypothetical protein
VSELHQQSRAIGIAIITARRGYWPIRVQMASLALGSRKARAVPARVSHELSKSQTGELMPSPEASDAFRERASDRLERELSRQPSVDQPSKPLREALDDYVQVCRRDGETPERVIIAVKSHYFRHELTPLSASAIA